MTAPLELSRRILVERMGAESQAIVEASPAECAAVAARLLLPGIARLRCVWRLRQAEAAMIEAEGSLDAAITQTCVVTLEPFEAVVQEAFEVQFVLEGRESGTDDPEEPDQLVYDGVAVDLGEAAVEQLALALDPYPRKPNAVLPATSEADSAGAFAALAKLRDLD